MRLDATARTVLLAYAWPGNVRELEHVLMRALLRAAGGGRRTQLLAPVIITTQHLDLDEGTPAPNPTLATAESAPESTGPLRQRLDAFTRSQLSQTLENRHGNWAATARELGLTPSNLQRLASRLGLR